MKDLLIAVAAGIVSAIVGALVTQGRWADKLKRARTWIIVIALLVGIGGGVYAYLRWLQRTGSGIEASFPAGTPEEITQCQPTGYRVELRISTSVGEEYATGTVDECQLLTARGRDRTWGVGFRPVVIAPGELVRIDVFRVQNPGRDQTLDYISSMGVKLGGGGEIDAPDEGKLIVTVESIDEG